ncbi:hypothetical protein [Rhodopila sp.]|uniref:hypothetical protein n=1 Tax=Rhodopila sp. TaxID=2480087 RepID=UPI003D0EA8B4
MRHFTAAFLLSLLAFTAPANAVQISAYPAAGTLTGTDIIPMVRAGTPGGFQTNPAAFAVYDQTHAPGTSGQFLFNSAGSMTTIAPASAASLLGLASVASTGAYGDLTGKPTLGTAATANTGTNGATLGLLNGNLTLSGAVAFTSALTIDRNAAALSAPRTGTILQGGNIDGTATRLEADAFAAPAFFTAVRSDGTAASPTAVQANDEMGGFNAYGYNGTALVGPQASFRAYASQNWTTGATGTYGDIAITPPNSITLTSVIRFESDTGVTVPPTVTGGDKGAGTINATGLYVNGAALITAATPTTYTAQQNFGTATLTDAATVTWNLNTAQTAKVTLGGNRTMATPTNMIDGGNYMLRVIQDGTGSRTITWNAVFKWPSGTAPTLSTGAGKVDLLSCTSDGASMLCVATLDLR